jgi:membrane protease YdiL (CAAX protease family)
MLEESTRKRNEILAVTITGLGKFLFMDFLNWKLPFILLAISAWLIYVIYQFRRNPEVVRQWGFRLDTFWACTKFLLPFGIASMLAFFAIGYFNKTLNLSWHIFPILILYPVWGIVQQYLVIALVAGNLQDLKYRNIGSAAIILTTALLFGLLHYPFWWLIAGTFVLALLYGFVFLKVRNIYALGLFHGWLGAFFFYTVVGRDPFVEVFGRVF